MKKLEEELRRWWGEQSTAEMEMCLEKAAEYGARDLEVIGHVLAKAAGLGTVSDRVAVQLGIAFYAQGKVARALDALCDGREPSSDTWMDLSVYGKMGLRARETGGWPGKEEA